MYISLSVCLCLNREFKFEIVRRERERERKCGKKVSGARDQKIVFILESKRWESNWEIGRIWIWYGWMDSRSFSLLNCLPGFGKGADDEPWLYTFPLTPFPILYLCNIKETWMTPGVALYILRMHHQVEVLCWGTYVFLVCMDTNRLIYLTPPLSIYSSLKYVRSVYIQASLYLNYWLGCIQTRNFPVP